MSAAFVVSMEVPHLAHPTTAIPARVRSMDRAYFRRTGLSSAQSVMRVTEVYQYVAFWVGRFK